MDKQYIQELILKDHYGLLAPDEREELDILLEYYEEVREMQDALRREVPVDEARSVILQFDPEQSYQCILAARSAWRKKVRNRRNRRMAALFAALLAGAIWYLLPPAGNPLPDEVAATVPGAVMLRLAGGQTVALGDTGRQQISLKDAVLNNNNRLLSFTPGKGAAGKGWNTLSVPAGKDYEVELTDGTRVWLNSATTMRFPFSFEEGVREVFVEGEAYFKVAPDATRPFIVHSGVTVVKVLGTEFNINAYLPGRIVTSLVQGKVSVHAEGEHVALEPGTAAVTRTGTPIKVLPAQPESLTWREGIFYFENNAMTEIAALMSRTYNVKVLIDNQRAREKTFRGRFTRDQSPQDIINMLNETGQVTLYWKNGSIHCK